MPKLVTPTWTASLDQNNSRFFIQDHYDGGHHRHPNDTCDSFAPEEMLPHPYKLFFSISIAATALVTLFLNLFVILTIIISNDNFRVNGIVKRQNESGRVQLRRKYSNSYLSFISLAVSVIMYSSICVPGMYLQTIDDHNKHNFVIRVLIFGFYVSPIASSFMHLLMAFDRFFMVKSSILMDLRKKWFQRHYPICIVLLWLFSILIIVPFFWYKKFSVKVQFIMSLIRLLITFAIPIVLTFALHLSIACMLDKHDKEKARELKESPGIKDQKTITEHQNMIFKIVTLAVVHLFCWLPFSVVESLNDLFPDLFHRCSTDIHMQIYYRSLSILILITSMSGIVYPVLYCFVWNNFKILIQQNLQAIFSTNKKTVRSSISYDSASQTTQKTELSSLIKTPFGQRKIESQV